MDRKLIVIGIAVITIIMILIGLLIVIFTLPNSGIDITTERITNSGMNGFPRIDGENIYWIADEKEVKVYRTGSKDIESVYTHDIQNEGLIGLHASMGHLVIQIYQRNLDDIFNSKTICVLMDASTKETKPLPVSGAYGLDFDYPYLVWHDLKKNMNLTNVDTDETIKIADANWGRVFENTVSYTVDVGSVKQAHVYDIVTGEDRIVHSVSEKSLYIVPGEVSYCIYEIEDFGEKAKTTIFSHDPNSNKTEKAGEYGDYIFYGSMAGPVLFFFDRQSDTIKAMDLDSGEIVSVSSNVKIASAVYGTIDSEGTIATWSSDKQVYFAEWNR